MPVDESAEEALKLVRQDKDEEQRREIYEWSDITVEFFEAVQELDLGELLHYEECFGLFEAMSAIEMMDKKMDIGMMDNGKEKNPPLTLEVAIQVK
jgi:hypothetical protein